MINVLFQHSTHLTHSAFNGCRIQFWPNVEYKCCLSLSLYGQGLSISVSLSLSVETNSVFSDSSIGTDMVYLFFSLSFTFCTDKVCLSLSLPEGQGLSCWIICIFILISHQLFSFLSDNKWGEFSLYLWRRALYDISPNISTMPQFILLKYQGRDGRVIWRAI